MKFIKIYAVGSLIVGILLTLDMYWLAVRPLSSLHIGFARLEYVWLLLSIVAIVVLVRGERSILVPVSYVVYTLLSWIHAFYLVYSGVVNEGFHLPIWVVVFGGVFGLYFAAVAFRLLSSLKSSQF